VLVRRSAVEATKHELRARGLKPQLILHRHIVAMAEARLMADPGWRAKLVAEARPMVDRWTAEGFFGKRAAQTAHNSEVTCASEVAGNRPLLRTVSYAHNGAEK
jgi:hypothetical protein